MRLLYFVYVIGPSRIVKVRFSFAVPEGRIYVRALSRSVHFTRVLVVHTCGGNGAFFPSPAWVIEESVVNEA